MITETSYEKMVEALENSSLPKEVIEISIDALGFTQAFHDFMVDWNMVKNVENKIDVRSLEEAFERLLGEFQAACLILASIKNSEKAIMETYKQVKDTSPEAVPSVVVEGYKKLSERVVNTRKSLMELEDVG